ETLVFLDSRELAFFEECNKNKKIKAVSLEPFIKEAEKVLGDAKLSHKIALHLITKYIPSKTLFVPAYFPLDMADFLRLKGVQLTVENPFRPQRAIKSKKEVMAIQKAIESTYPV